MSGFILNQKSVVTNVKPFLSSGHDILRDAYSDSKHLSIPKSFSYYTELHQLPNKINEHFNRVGNIRNWLEEALATFGSSDYLIQQQMEDVTSMQRNAQITSASTYLTGVSTYATGSSYAASSSLMGQNNGNYNNSTKNYWKDGINGITRSLQEEGIPALKATAASIGMGATSLVKGVASFGEALGDGLLTLSTVASTPITALIDLGSSAIQGELNFTNTEAMWNDIKDFTQKNLVEDAFDEFYEKNELGAWMNENAVEFMKNGATGAKVLEGVGYIGGVILLNAATFGTGSAALTVGGTVGTTGASAGIAVGSAAANTTGAVLTIGSSSLSAGAIAAVAGLGKNTAAAWNDGAETINGLVYGGVKGLWEGFEMTLGHAINSLKIFKTGTIAAQLGNTASHVALDTIDGATGGIVDPLFTMIYSPNQQNMEQIMYFVNYDENGVQINNKTWEELSFNEKYDAIFRMNGGWKNVGIQAASAGVMSFLSEIPDVVKVVKEVNGLKPNVALENTNATIVNRPKDSDVRLSLKLKNAIDNLANNSRIANKVIHGVNVVRDFGASMLMLPTKIPRFSLEEFPDLYKNAYENGIYHVTTLEAAEAILKSGEVRPSGIITSYGAPSSFFFNGTPKLSDIAHNISSTDSTLVAVKILPTKEMLSEMDVRYLNDSALMHKGALHFSPGSAEIVNLGLTMENGIALYKQIDAKDVSSYAVPEGITNLLKQENAITLGFKNQTDQLVNLPNKLKSLFFKPEDLKNTGAIIADSSDSIWSFGKINPIDTRLKTITQDLLDGKMSAKEMMLNFDASQITKAANNITDAKQLSTFISTIMKEDANSAEQIVKGLDISHISDLLNIYKKDYDFDSFFKTLGEVDNEVRNMAISTSDLRDVLQCKKSLYEEYYDIISRLLVENQNSYFLRIDFSNRAIVEKIIEDPAILTQLSDLSLMKLGGSLAVNKEQFLNSKLFLEIQDRIKNGKLMIDAPNTTISSFGMSISDINSFYGKLPKELRDVILENGKNVWHSLPDSLRHFDYGTISQQLHLSSLYNNGKLPTNVDELLKKIVTENVNGLKTFNFDILDKNIISTLGEDFVFDIGKYDIMSQKVVSLFKNSPQAFDLFSKLVKNNSLEDSLQVSYIENAKILDYIFDNQARFTNLDMSKVDLEDITDYILYSGSKYGNIAPRYNIGLDMNYRSRLIEICDQTFDNAKDISQMKEAYFQKYFSISYKEAQELLYRYGQNIESVSKFDSDETLLTIMDAFKKIDDCTDSVKLKEIYNNQDMYLNAKEILYLENNFKSLYTESYEEALSKMTKRVDSLIETGAYRVGKYQGKDVKIIDASDDFSMLVYSSDTGFIGNKTLINDSYKETWQHAISPKVHAISTTYIDAKNMGTAPVEGDGVLYGFSHVGKDRITSLSPYDLNSHIADYGFEVGNKQLYVPADQMSFNSTRVYNEVVLDRSDIKPDYVVLYSDASQKIQENALKAAAEWDIPIINIDRVKLIDKNLSEVSRMLDSFNQKGNAKELEQALLLFESTASGLKLNTIEDIGYLSAIDNSQYLSKFKTQEINQQLTDYIQKMKLNSTQDNLTDVIQVLEKIKGIYETANAQGTKLVDKTKSLLDIDGLIKLAKGEV